MSRILVLDGATRSMVGFRGPFLKALVDRGHEVYASTGFESYAAAAQVEALGATFVPHHLDRAGTNALHDAHTLASMAKLIGRVRPDVLLSYTVKAVTYGQLAGRALRVPTRIATITGLGNPWLAGGRTWAVVKRLYRRSLSGCRVVIFQNEADRDVFVAQGLLAPGARTAVVNGSGIDTARFQPSPPPTSPLSFVLIARLIGEKGIRDYVDAARRLKAVHPEVQVRLLGPYDPNPTSLQPAEVEAWVREGVIDYLGQTPDVRPFLRDASVFVLPSYREGTTRAGLEAMASGRPVITTDTPGCREIVEVGRSGFLVPVRDGAALAEAMARYVADPSLLAAHGARGRALAESRYAVEVVNQQIFDATGL